MDGPSHYREAEKCLALVNGAGESAVVPTLDECQTMIAIAQVHATLALAAATAESFDPDGLSVPDWTSATKGSS